MVNSNFLKVKPISYSTHNPTDDNRKKIFSSIPKIISTIKSKYDEKTSNQTNLFERKFSQKN